MAMIERFPAAAPANSVLELGTVGATVLIILAIGWAMHWLEGHFESGRQFFGRIDAGVAKNPLSTTTDRTALPPLPQQIVSPRRTYTLVGQLAAGDLCDVHHAIGDDVEWVLKVSRGSSADELLIKEHHVLRQLIDAADDSPYRCYFPQADESFRIDARRVNVYGHRTGLFTAEQVHRRFPDGLEGRHLAWMFNRTLEALGFVHSNGWIHGAVLPPHLMFHVDSHGLQLAGWIHAVNTGGRLRIAPQRYRDWYPPECHRRQPVTPSVDLSLAARSMIYLAGGDPVTNRVPDHVPAAIRRLLQSCVLESVCMRPQDAWELHAEFRVLLEGVYGPPEFHVLDMTGDAHGNHSMV